MNPPRSFTPGQCWTSEAEPELGIGFVRAKSPQTVTLEFPLVSETRTYGLRSAPLKRLEFRVGDAIQAADGRRLKVASVEEREGVLWYQPEAGDAIAETELSPQAPHPTSTATLPGRPLGSARCL